MVAGLGPLGLPVAVALARAGYAVTGLEINDARRQQARSQGVTVAEATPDSRLWQSADALLTVLPNDAAVSDLLEGLHGGLAHLPARAMHLCLGTIGVELAQRLARLHRQAGQHFAACPVFGRPDEAWARDLTALFGPAESDDTAWHARATQILSPLAPRLHRMPSPEAACALKLAGNLMIASAIATFSEASRLVRAYGASAHALHQVVTGKLFRGPVYEGVGARIAQAADCNVIGNEPAGFSIRLGLKDLGLVQAAAKPADVALAVGEAVHDTLARAEQRGYGHADWADLPACLSDRGSDESL